MWVCRVILRERERVGECVYVGMCVWVRACVCVWGVCVCVCVCGCVWVWVGGWLGVVIDVYVCGRVVSDF